MGHRAAGRSQLPRGYTQGYPRGRRRGYPKVPKSANRLGDTVSKATCGELAGTREGDPPLRNLVFALELAAFSTQWQQGKESNAKPHNKTCILHAWRRKCGQHTLQSRDIDQRQNSVKMGANASLGPGCAPSTPHSPLTLPSPDPPITQPNEKTTPHGHTTAKANLTRTRNGKTLNSPMLECESHENHKKAMTT